MNKSTAYEILKEIFLTPTDAARLVMECIETMSEENQPNSRQEVMIRVRRVIQAGCKAIQEEEATVSLETAAWQSVENRADRRSTTKRDLRHYVRRILRVPGVAERPLRSLKTRDCRRILQTAFGTSASSYVKGRAILHSIFSYGMRYEWCDNNPVSCIEVPKVQEKYKAPLSPEEVKKLKEVTKQPAFRDMQFSLGLMLYAGMRPMEVCRLTDNDIFQEEQQIIVRPPCSKTGGGRTVSLRCIRGISPQDMIIPRNWDKKWRALRRAAGFRHWVPDVCRHTFASYHAAFFRNLTELQLEMGHRDTTLLRSRYIAPILQKDAAAFWQKAPFSS